MVSDGIGDAAEDAAHPLHAFVAHHDKVGADLVGEADDGFGGITHGGVVPGLYALLGDAGAQLLEQKVGGVGEAVEELVGSLSTCVGSGL